MSDVFLSYSRQSEDAARHIAADLQGLNHTIWFDDKLTGGQAWWDQILEKIRRCDVFVFVLDPASLDSTACTREREYASAVGKPVLPILVADGVSTNLLPETLSEIQFVDYRRRDRDAAFKLVRAMADVREAAPLPDPLPEPPDVPLSYLVGLAARVDSAELGRDEQRLLLLDLVEALKDPPHAADARVLLERFRKRPDLYAQVEREIDRILGHSKPPVAWRGIAAGVAALAVALVLVWFLAPWKTSGDGTAAPVANLSASAYRIERGNRVTLSWETGNADSVRLEPLGPVPASGSRAVEPIETTEYELVAAGASETSTDRITIEVTDPPRQAAAVIDEFTASRTSIAAGETITLTWRTSNAEKVELEPLDNVPLSGSHDIRLTKDMEFVLLAYGTGGNARRSVRVSVAASGPMDAAEAKVFVEKVLAEVRGEIDRGDVAAARETAERAMAYERLPPEYQARLKDAVSAMLREASVADSSYLPVVRVAPVYPQRALSRGLEGYVDLEFTVTTSGTVVNPKVVESTSSLFDEAAIRAVLKFKYKPRVVDGRVVETPGVRTRVTFRIEE